MSVPGFLATRTLAGNNYYQYALPTPLSTTSNFSDMYPMTPNTSNVGTKVGNCVCHTVGVNNAIGSFFSTASRNNGLILWLIAGNGSIGFQGNTVIHTQGEH